MGALLVVAAVAAMVWRRPEYFTHPGFYAEEGRVYFFRAWHDPWWRFLPSAPAGYFLLFTNVAVLLAARLVDVAHAPLVTTLLACAVQTSPIAVIAFGAAPEWRSAVRRAAAIGLVLTGSLSSAIWLNTINSQCYFAVLSLLILLEPADLRPARSRAYAALLAIAGASGPVAASLAPLFCWKAWRTRARAARLLAVVAAAGLALQLAVVAATGGGPYMGGRGSGMTIGTVAGIVWMRTIVLPLLGPGAADRFATALLDWTGGDLGTPRAILLGTALLLAAIALVAWLGRRLSPRERLALACGYLWIAAVASLLAFGPQRLFLGSAHYSSRYFYAPGVALLLLLLANARLDAPRGARARSATCAILVAVALATGIARYPSSLRWRPTWPDWRSEVAAWRSDPGRSLRIWPEGWRIFYLYAPSPPGAATRRRRAPAPSPSPAAAQARPVGGGEPLGDAP